jgi:hypothetical protein
VIKVGKKTLTIEDDSKFFYDGREILPEADGCVGNIYVPAPMLDWMRQQFNRMYGRMEAINKIEEDF